MAKFGETRGGVGKVACWSTKAAISLKRVKIEENLPSKAYRNSPSLFRTVPSRHLFPKIGGLQPQPKTAIAIISGTGKVIRTANLADTFTESIRIIWEKRERGRIQGLPTFLSTPYYLRNGGKATHFRILYAHS